MEFACRQLRIEEVIRCSLDLRKSEYTLIECMVKEKHAITIQDISKKLKLDRTTVQKMMKRFYAKSLVERYQENLDGGGYIFTYKLKNKELLKQRIKEIIKSWYESVNTSVDKW
ncbi:MAG: MarR family transcriptional regulator [Candidatus Woesearchaeota archaeon]